MVQKIQKISPFEDYWLEKKEEQSDSFAVPQGLLNRWMSSYLCLCDFS
jgi:hypothetical protein